YAPDTFGLHRAGLDDIDPLRRALEDTTLVTDDRGSGLEAAVVVDFLGVVASEGGEIAVGRKPRGDLGGHEGCRPFLERGRRRVRGARLVGRGRYPKMRQAFARALSDRVRGADAQNLEQENIVRRFDQGEEPRTC